MDSLKINRMILDKVEARDLPPRVRAFMRELLQHEQGGLDQDMPRYSRAYKRLLNKYARERSDASDSEDER